MKLKSQEMSQMNFNKFFTHNLTKQTLLLTATIEAKLSSVSTISEAPWTETQGYKMLDNIAFIIK
jgi:hypothetical protein